MCTAFKYSKQKNAQLYDLSDLYYSILCSSRIGKPKFQNIATTKHTQTSQTTISRMAQQERQTVSKFPFPPRRYYHNCATDQPAPPAPPPPATSPYHMFGREYSTEDTQPSLEQSGRNRLYDPAKPTTQQLRLLNSHLLQTFLKLVRQLCEAPSQTDSPHEVIANEIEDLFVNMQFLINLMRPTQAAMDLKALLDSQTDARKSMTTKLRQAVNRSWDLVSEAAGGLSTPSVQLSAEALAPLDEIKAAANPTTTSADEARTERPPAQSDQLALFASTPPAVTHDMLSQLAQIVADPSL